MKKIILIIIIFVTAIFFIYSKDNDVNTPNIWKDAKEKFEYFNNDNLERYKSYKEKNPNMKIEEIIVYVNIGLDNSFYTNTKPSKNINSNTVIVNKYNYLEKDYVPNNLVSINGRTKMVDYAAEAFNKMISDAKRENYNIIGVSGYRSYNYQSNLYNKYVKQDGVEKTDTYSARAGFSEHQTGLAIDVSNDKLSYTSFEKTKEFNWMQENAYKYGFIMRYPKDKENITGYSYESWHYRYVGKEIANYIKKHNITYDEYYAMFLDK